MSQQPIYQTQLSGTEATAELLNRFEHLLRPIRDPQQNWTVDLTTELNNAIEMLQNTMIAFGQSGGRIIDFSKAAMIIQGSAHVYSKKVDHLYNAVQDMRNWLEDMNTEDGKSKKRDGGSSRRGRHPGSVSTWDDDVDDLFDESDDDEEDKTLMKQVETLDPLSVGVLLPKKLNSAIFTPLNMKTHLSNVKGDVIGTRADFLLSNIRNLEELLLLHTAVRLDESMEMIDEADLVDLPQAGEDNPPVELRSDGDSDDVGPVDMDNTLVNEIPPPFPDTPILMNSDQNERRQLRSNANAINKEPTPPPVDPWTELFDPDVPSIRQSKKRNTGTTRKLPLSLTKKRGKKRKQDGGKSVPESPISIMQYCTQESDAPPSIPGTSSIYPEIKSIFSEELRQRYNELRKSSGSVSDRLSEGLATDEQCDLEMGGFELEADGHYDDDDNDIPLSRLTAPAADGLNEAANLTVNDYGDYINKLQQEYEEKANLERLSDIELRVKNWEKTVKQAVDIAETRPPFEMGLYTHTIFDSFNEDSDRIHFDKILEGRPKYEAYRTFVSALILANHGNIDLEEDKDDHQMKVKLVNRTTHSDQLLEKDLAS